MKKIYFLCSLFLIFNMQIRVQSHLDDIKAEHESLRSTYLFQPTEVLNTLIAGGFRGVAVDLLWVRLDDYSHEGQWYKLLPIFKTVTFLQPNFIVGWSVGGWHMAFNLYYQAKKPEEKREWLKKGLNFLKEGLIHNSRQYELYFELGWTYFFKAKDYPNAIRYLKHGAQFPHPQFVDHVLAHAYEMNHQLREALTLWENLQKSPTHAKRMEPVVNRQVIKLRKELSSGSKDFP
ncbi:MAG: hypothetical protein HYS08_05480 [Chlamydiae bacterium]|nr:hypothetical protein [Chlamydiota bacterium]